MRLNSSTVNGATTVLTYSYKWYDGAAQSRIASNQGALQGATSFKYDLNGRLTQVYDSTTAKQRVLRYETDGEGPIVKRNEYSQEFGDAIIANQTTGEVNGYSASATGDIRTFRYYYDQNGNRIGEVNNVGQPASSRDYVADLASKKLAYEPAAKEDKNKRFVPTLWADFDQNYQRINSDYPSKAASSFAVRTGDTLRSIAQTVWGDSSQWWRIAELNGLIGNETLTTGLNLLIPNKVANSSNNASTFKVYEPGEAIGNTSPNLPDPARKKCNGFVAVLAVVVGAIVFVATSGAVSGIIGQVLAGALSSTASQLVNIAGGNQSSFSWRQVAIGAIGGAVSGALGEVNGYAKFISDLGGSTVQAIANAAISSTISQGISSAVGLQAFSWRNVAGAALGAGIGDLAAIGLNKLFSGLDLKTFDASKLAGSNVSRPFELTFSNVDLGQTVARSLVGLLSGAASSAVVNRGKVDWRGVAVNAFGATIGDVIRDQTTNNGALDPSKSVDDEYAAETARFRRSADTTDPRLAWSKSFTDLLFNYVEGREQALVWPQDGENELRIIPATYKESQSERTLVSAKLRDLGINRESLLSTLIEPNSLTNSTDVLVELFEGAKRAFKDNVGLEDKPFRSFVGKGLGLIFKGFEVAETAVEARVARHPAVIAMIAIYELAKNSDIGVGKFHELIVKSVFEVTGIFEKGSLRAIQNKSDQGIDLIGKAATGALRNQWIGLELKASGHYRAKDLEGDQRLGPDTYLRSRLSRAAKAGPGWMSGFGAEEDLAAFAKRVLLEQGSKPFEGFVIRSSSL